MLAGCLRMKSRSAIQKGAAHVQRAARSDSGEQPGAKEEDKLLQKGKRPARWRSGYGLEVWKRGRAAARGSATIGSAVIQ